MSEFLTLAQTGQAEYLVKGSRFIALAIPVKDESDCKTFIQNLKVAHPSAAHICYAWVLQEPKRQYRYYDDGEPGGSAGLPIYHNLLRLELCRCAVAVVRYFGGKKLGIPGLIEAYSESAKLAILDAGIEKQSLKYNYELIFPVDEMWQLYTVTHIFGLEILNVNTSEGRAEVSSGSQHFTQEDELRRLYPIFDIQFKGCY